MATERSAFHEALARAIEEGGTIVEREQHPMYYNLNDPIGMLETVTLEFDSPEAASRALKLVRSMPGSVDA